MKGRKIIVVIQQKQKNQKKEGKEEGKEKGVQYKEENYYNKEFRQEEIN